MCVAVRNVPINTAMIHLALLTPLLFPTVLSCPALQLRLFFKHCLEPILTPLAVDPGHPFPFIGNMTLAIAVVRRGEEEQTG